MYLFEQLATKLDTSAQNQNSVITGHARTG
jgi:hypothetical protein